MPDLKWTVDWGQKDLLERVSLDQLTKLEYSVDYLKLVNVKFMDDDNYSVTGLQEKNS